MPYKCSDLPANAPQVHGALMRGCRAVRGSPSVLGAIPVVDVGGGVSMDVWGKLWEIACGLDKPARIEVDPDDCGTVTLVWPDGTRGAWYWHEGDWRACEGVDTAPCDVAARDAL